MAVGRSPLTDNSEVVEPQRPLNELSFDLSRASSFHDGCGADEKQPDNLFVNCSIVFQKNIGDAFLRAFLSAFLAFLMAFLRFL